MLRGAWILVAGFFISSAFADYPVRPNPSQTPGGLCTEEDRDFSGYRYAEHIPYCQRDVNRHMKARVYADYDIPSECRHKFTVDHFYPLSMGGNNTYQNLWPEHLAIKALRQNLELDVFEQLRDGELTQKEALNIIEDAKMNPPIDQLNKMVMSGDRCDRAAAEAYLSM